MLRDAEATHVNYRSRTNFVRLRAAAAVGVTLGVLVLAAPLLPASATAHASGAGQSPSFADQAAMANAVNTYTGEMGYYAENAVFTANGPALDPTIPWSKTVRPGHVTLHVGCDAKLGDPRSFAASTRCNGRAPKSVLVQSEEAGGTDCFSVFGEQTQNAGSSWFNYDGTCSVPLPIGKAREGQATQRKGTGWYTSF
jgi:hypothetical protein